MRALSLMCSLILLGVGPAALAGANEGRLVFNPVGCTADGKNCLLVVDGRALPEQKFAGTAADKRAAEKASLTPTGETRDCLLLREIREAMVRDDNTIDYELNNRQVWRNSLPHACPGLGSERRYLFKSTASEVCSIDSITVLQAMGSSVIHGATCGLGRFERVQKTAS